MGSNSKYHRFHGAGEQANVNNVQRFGYPAISLFTSTKLFTLHHHIDITDAYENVVYCADTKVFTIKDKTDVRTANGQHVSRIERKLISFHEVHYITMANGFGFELSNELLHIYKDVTNIVGLGWQLRGNVFGLNFELYDRDGSVIAVIGQKMLSIHDKYCIDIYKREYEAIVVSILIALQHMIKDRENANSASYSSSNYN